MRLFAASILSGLCTLSAMASQDTIDVSKFSPPITSTEAIDNPHGWPIAQQLRRAGLKPFKPLIPSYNGQGKLLASWNPRSEPEKSATVIVVHGGHGVSPGNIQKAIQMIDRLNANVLILDRYWSRGRTENWLAWTEFGANMRVLDALAAARWVQKKGVRPDATFLAGDSQGGWTVLRTFSNHNLADEVRARFAGGIAQYPNCYVKTSRWFGAAPTGERDAEKAPPLGDYSRPVLVFTGGKDEATPLSQCDTDTVFKDTQWKHFPQATHAYDSPNRGVGRDAVHGECSKAVNIYNRFPVCHDAEVTAETLGLTYRFIESLMPLDLKASSD